VRAARIIGDLGGVMPDRRLVAIVTGLMLIVGGLAARAAEPTLEQLRVIDTLLSRNDTQGLLDFLKGNPALLAGEDELSAELRNFAKVAAGGRLRMDYVPAPTYARPPQVTSAATSASTFPGIY